MRSDAEPSARQSIGQRVRGIGGGASIVPLLILFGLNSVDELDRTAFSLLLPEIQEEFGLGLTGITTLAAAVVPAALLFGLPVARLADRWKRVPIAITGASVWGAFSILTGIVPTLLLLGMMRVGAGLGRAVNDPVHGSLLSDFYPPTSRAKVFASHRTANVVGAFTGPLVAGILADLVGWRVPFIVLAFPTFALVIAALVWLREPPRTGESLSEMPSKRLTDAFRLLWSVRTLRWIWLAFPFIAFVALGMSQIMSLYYAEIFGVPVRTRGFIQSLDAPFIVLGLVVGSPLIDRGIAADPGRVMRFIGLGAATIALFILGIAVAPALWVGVGFNYAINSLSFVLYAGGFAVVSLTAPPEARASAFAFFNISSLLGIVAIPAVGQIGDAVGLRWGLAALVPILFVGALVLARSGRYANADIDRVNPRREVPPEAQVMPPPPPAPPGDSMN